MHDPGTTRWDAEDNGEISTSKNILQCTGYSRQQINASDDNSILTLEQRVFAFVPDL